MFPLGAAYQGKRLVYKDLAVQPTERTILSAPAAERLVEIECGSTMAQLNIREPFRDDIEHSRV